MYIITVDDLQIPYRWFLGWLQDF